jgi:hypothetical protein
LEVEAAEVAGDVDGFSNEEEAGNGAGFQGARVQAAGVDATGGDFGLLKTLSAGGMEGEGAETAF